MQEHKKTSSKEIVQFHHFRLEQSNFLEQKCDDLFQSTMDGLIERKSQTNLLLHFNLPELLVTLRL